MTWPEAFLAAVAIVAGLPILVILLFGIIMFISSFKDEKKSKDKT